MQVVLATRNAGKVVELQRILKEFPEAKNLEIVGLNNFPNAPEVEENGNTFIENALLKAHAIADSTGLPAIADDSGICVDYLNGAPGIYSARYAGIKNNNADLENNKKLLAALENIPDKKRTAHFYCAAVFATPSNSKPSIEIISEGKFHGRIGHEMRGNGGFGYDPLFIPDNQNHQFGNAGESTSAELTAEEKDAISHRGIALRALVPKILSSYALG